LLLIGNLSSVGATRGMPKWHSYRWFGWMPKLHSYPGNANRRSYRWFLDLPVATRRSLLQVVLSKWHFIY